MKGLLLVLIFAVVVVAQTPLQPVVEVVVPYPPNTTASQEMIRFIPPNNHDPFGFYHRTTMFGNDQTNSVGWGFYPQGSPQGAPSLVFLMEDTFGGDNTDAAQIELHLQLASTEGGGDRPWTWTFNRKTGDTFVGTSAKHIAFYTAKIAQPANNVQLMDTEFQVNMLNGPFRIAADSVIFQTATNAGANAKQIRITPHPSDPSLSQLMFGDSNGVGLANVGGDLQVTKMGASAAVDVSAVKVNGTKVVGAQCSAIPDPDPATGRMGETNNATVIAILNCLRSHGLMAQ